MAQPARLANSFRLEGRRALVTGANTGIGQGIAIALAEAGAEVIGVARSSMAETEALIRQVGGHCRSLKADLGQADQRQALIEQAAGAFGPLDILVNNAGIIRRADALEFSEQDWDEVMDLNLKAVFFLAQSFAKHVLARAGRGKIINIASLLSFQGG
ncbi:MAG: SDR family NAD(P)-dependent oxidoreductase, partial [Rhabdaerophilum sp.]